MLTIIGSLASSAVGVIPWAGPRTMLVLLYLLLAITLIGGPAGAVYVHMRTKMADAEETINLRWETKLAEAEKTYVQMAHAAVLAAASVDDVPTDTYQLDGLCQQNASCRDRGGAHR